MGDDYMKYPVTVKTLATEIIRICNDYNSRKISNERIREMIFWYATEMSDKLFAGDDINPTIKKMIGQKRITLINKLLDGYQYTLEGRLHATGR